MRINWNEPRFDKKELEEVSKVIKENYVNEGPKTKELEEKIKDYLGVKYVILTTSATAALFLAVKADSLIKGKENFEVIVPDLTMIATATAVEWAGGKPVLVDVEKERGTINVEKIEEKITDKTTAIVPVHILGRAPEMDKIIDIANKYNLSIIEDAAGALGSKYKGKFLGTIGKIGCFSLQSNKVITSGQGGIIVTNDERYYEIMRRLRDFGRMSNKEFLHEKVGYNLKFNDLSAALALGQFIRLDEKIKMLIEQKERYEELLKEISEISFFKNGEEEVPLWVDSLVEDREKLIEYLNLQNIYPRRCWPALHKNPPYKNRGGDEDFPNSAYISKNCLWLPNGPAISDEQIVFICNKIKDFYKNSQKFKEMELKKIHEDQRGYIYLVKNLLEDNKEFTFLEIKKGYARGGCLHSKDENLVVIKGKVRYICGDREKILSQGNAEITPAGEPHAVIALEDSIVSEWGVTTEEKEINRKDDRLKMVVDKINKNGKEFV